MADDSNRSKHQRITRSAVKSPILASTHTTWLTLYSKQIL